MTGIYSDDLIPGLASLAETVHQEGGRIITQINHGGMQCDPQTVEDPIAPSAVGAPRFERTARQMSLAELDTLIEAYGQAARRTKEAGFDGVQIHAAHGYLISEFLSPHTNRRSDQWGGDLNNRMRFLREVIRSVRAQVGSEYPVLIKLGMMDGIPGGLTLEDSLQVVGALEEMEVDGVELSGGIQVKQLVNVRKGIRSEGDEAYFLNFAQAAKTVTRLPVSLVGGFRSRNVMENVLSDGHADFISLCRPLINDPYFPQQMRMGLREKSRCISSNNCWAERAGQGIACKCPIDKIP
jgi:2,4-dienoyl-CoA reductase-like NADH-dependent reductase (Old Yellow Enzyme family)